MLLAGPEATSDGLSNVVAIAVMVGYYVVFEAAFGWTVGKLITGTRVKRVDGGKPRVFADHRSHGGALHPLRAILGGLRRR